MPEETKPKDKDQQTSTVTAEPGAPRGPGRPAKAKPAAPPVQEEEEEQEDPYANSVYTGPSEIVEGGQYIRKARMVGVKLYGGEIADANGKVLAVFKNDQVNTGRVEDGTPPEEE